MHSGEKSMHIAQWVKGMHSGGKGMHSGEKGMHIAQWVKGMHSGEKSIHSGERVCSRVYTGSAQCSLPQGYYYSDYKKL